MLRLLALRHPEFEANVFRNSPDMIGWLREHLLRIRLLSLDHDLGPNQLKEGNTFDPGTGRDVADFLATQTPQCHVILHTTNRLAAPGMQRVLNESGWTVSQVVPYGDLDWISERWITEVGLVVQSRDERDIE
jgi:hypothetical protein